MISGIVPFEEIIQSVKDETGIENLRSLYEKIRRLMFRAEREIGYGGTVDIFKKTYKLVGVTGGDCNFGKFFKFPSDFIEFEGVGKFCKPISSNFYRVTSEGVRFPKKQTEDFVLLYWGIKTDDEGNPCVTRNHEEAVIAYIVWKLYSSRIFLGIGNMNAKKDYEQTFNMSLLEARGDDAFPTLEEMGPLGILNNTDRRLLLDEPVHGYNYCIEYEDIVCSELSVEEGGTGGQSLPSAVYAWQQDSLTDDIDNVVPLINTIFLNEKPVLPLSIYENSYENIYNKIGVICFAITNTENISYSFIDVLQNDVTTIFDTFYFLGSKTKLYVSKNKFSFSQVTYQILKP